MKTTCLNKRVQERKDYFNDVKKLTGAENKEKMKEKEKINKSRSGVKKLRNMKVKQYQFL